MFVIVCNIVFVVMFCDVWECYDILVVEVIGFVVWCVVFMICNGCVGVIGIVGMIGLWVY